MGQKVHPVGFRLGYIRRSESTWFVKKSDYARNILEDEKIRSYIYVRLVKAGVTKVLIDRGGGKIMVTIHTTRPGVVIGKSGSEVDKLRGELKKLIGKEIEINISELKKPDLDARFVGDQIAQQIRNRASYKRVVKQSVSSVMRSGAQGIKVQVSGRLDGAEMARSVQFKEGVTPLHTLRNNIDYAMVEAHTIYGRIGIKVWISKGVVSGLPVK